MKEKNFQELINHFALWFVSPQVVTLMPAFSSLPVTIPGKMWQRFPKHVTDTPCWELATLSISSVGCPPLAPLAQDFPDNLPIRLDFTVDECRLTRF